MGYIINRWALIRRGELSVTPDTIEIHQDFLHTLSREDFESAFRTVGDIFYQLMTDISLSPERFAMPLCDEATTRYGAPEAQDSRFAAWRPMKLLYTVFTNGNLGDRGFSVDIHAFREANNIKNSHILFNILHGYGFEFSGLSNGKITPKVMEINVNFPENQNIINVLALTAQKAAGVNAADLFYRWSYRLLMEGFGENSYCGLYYAVHDKTRTGGEREFIRRFHQTMAEMGFYHADGGWNEGPGVSYYDREAVMKRKGPYLYRVIDWMGDLRLMLRIRNAEKCMDLFHGADMPPEITEMFKYSDPGCGSHANGSCNKGVVYNFDGQPRWRCGCCNAPFWLRPKADNIPVYIKMVETGEKK